MCQAVRVRHAVKEVSIDMWGGFDKVIAQVFPNAQVVTDRFHVMKPLIKELNTIAHQVGIRGWKNKAILLRNQEQLTPQQLEELNQLLSQSKRIATA